MDRKIKAPENKVIRGWLYEINPFQRGLVRRCLIDEYGLVLVHGSGWSKLQPDYHIVTLPGAVAMWNLQPAFDGYWWESKAWAQPAWNWIFSHSPPNFLPCRIQDGCVFAA